MPRSGGWGPIAPARAARRTITVEERLQKLEGMNQRLNEQNQQLTDELKTVTQKVNAPDPQVYSVGSFRSYSPLLAAPTSSGVSRRRGRRWWWRTHGPAERSGSPGFGVGVNVLSREPMPGSAYGRFGAGNET